MPQQVLVYPQHSVVPVMAQPTAYVSTLRPLSYPPPIAMNQTTYPHAVIQTPVVQTNYPQMVVQQNPMFIPTTTQPVYAQPTYTNTIIGTQPNVGIPYVQNNTVPYGTPILSPRQVTQTVYPVQIIKPASSFMSPPPMNQQSQPISTEYTYTGKYNDNYTTGDVRCPICNQLLSNYGAAERNLHVEYCLTRAK